LLKEETLSCCFKDIGKKNVVGELYHGNSHTTNPKWIKDFLGRGYIYYQLSSMLVWRHILSDLQKRPDKKRLE
jgi:hypothetical protein